MVRDSKVHTKEWTPIVAIATPHPFAFVTL